jgi:hypothetical protein
MGIANIVNTSGGGGGSSEIITHLVNSVDGAGLRLASSASIKCNDVAANRFGTADFSIEFVISQNAEVANSDIFTSSADYTTPTNPTAKSAAVIRWDVSGNGNLSLVIFNSTGTGATYDFGVSLTADVDKPTHFVVSADRSAYAVLFRNGAEVASVDISASASENIGVGGYPAVVGLPNGLGFKGNIYRLRTYSKLLSTDEAKNVFDRADVPTALVSNLLLDLDCAYANPSQSTVIQDRGPNNQDGTLNGTITQTNVIKQLNSVSARIGTSSSIPADGTIHIGDTTTTPLAGADDVIIARGSGDAGVTIRTATGSTGQICFADGNTGNEAYRGFIGYAHGTDKLNLGSGGATHLAIDATGQVGIGTGAGTILAKLNAKGTQGNWRIDPDSVSTEIQVLATNPANNGFIDYRLRANQVILDAGGSTALTIASTGSVLMKRTSASDAATVAGHTIADGVINSFSAAGKQYRFYETSGSGQEVGHITVSSSATTYSTSSDYRLKENLTPLTGALDRLDQLPVYRFNFKADSEKTVDGFIAHEVSEHVPESITGEKDGMRTVVVQEAVEAQPATYYEEGDELPEGKAVGDEKTLAVEAVEEVTEEQPDYQGIDQSKLVPLLVAAVKELKAKVETLENS